MTASRLCTRSLLVVGLLSLGLTSTVPVSALPECPFVVTGFPAGLHADRFVLGDFDGDGIPDVVAVQQNVPYGNGGAVFLRGVRTNGYTLAPAVTIATGDLSEVVTGDFNSDGKADLALLDHASRQVRILRGLGNGTFAAPVLYDTQDDPAGLAVGDVNSDGIADLLIANGGTSPQLLMGNGLNGHGNGTFTSRSGPYTPYHAVSMFAGDWDGDGIADIAVEELSDTAVAVYRGRGANGIWNGDWDAPVRYKLNDPPTYIRALDVDGDGHADLVCCTYNGISTLLYGDGHGGFHTDGSAEVFHTKAPFGVADWTHDGRKTLVIADPGDLTLRLRLVASPATNSSDGLVTSLATRGNTVASAVADLDGDGIDDAIAVSRDSSVFTVMLQHCPSLAPLAAASAGWVPDGARLTTTPGAKSAPQVAGDGKGGAFITWSDGATTPAHAVLQHLLPDGRRDPAWTEGGVALLPRASGATAPQVVNDGGTGAWVFWDEAPAAGRSIYGARVLADGRVPDWWNAFGYSATGLGDGLAGTFNVRADGRRGWVQSWLANGGSDARQQRWTGVRVAYAAAGSAGVPVGAVGTARTEPLAVADGGDGVFQAWRTQDPLPSGARIVLARTSASGAVSSGWPATGVVLAGGAGDRHLLDFAPDGRGGVFALWSDVRSGIPTIFAQHVDSAGVVLGTPSGVRVSDLGAEQREAHLAVLPNGEALIVFVVDSGDGGNLYAQHLASAGLASDASTAGRALCTASGAQGAPAILSDELGGAFVVWQDGRGADLDVYATHIDGTAHTIAGWAVNGARICGASDDQSAPRLATLGSGQAIVAWSDLRSGVATPYAARLSPSAPITAVEDGARAGLALASVSPNPSRGRFAIRFTLPQAGAATLELLDIAGRRVLHRDLGVRAAGMHEWNAGDDVRLAAGVYLARLSQHGESRTARVVVLR